MRYSISDTAEYGDYSRGSRLIDENVKKKMKEILAEIQSGKFAQEWIAENEKGRPYFNAQREKEAQHPIEVVGKQLRSMMPFLKPKKKETTGAR
jgi:ketol-acid reductoisomerase